MEYQNTSPFFSQHDPRVYSSSSIFYLITKLKEEKERKAAFCSVQIFPWISFSSIFYFHNKTKRGRRKKRYLPPLNKKRSFSPQGLRSRILPYPKVVKGEGENEKKFFE